LKFSLALHYSRTPELARRLEEARALGFDGVELLGLSWSQANPFPDAADLRRMIANSGLALAGVTGDAVVADLKTEKRRAWRFEETIGLAREMQSPWVKVTLLPGPEAHSAGERGVEASTWLEAMVADAAGGAGGAGMMILLQNGGALPTARDLWLVLDRLSHPALAAAYHVLNGLLAGESPTVALGLLNRRIRQVTMEDLRWEGEAPRTVPLGTGQLPLDLIAARLRGMGYEGWLTLPADPTFPGDPRLPLDRLRDDLATLRAVATRPGPKSWQAELAAKAKPAGRKA
jgi:sugar phosphate isomerase/epimerase